jgi:FG-GAP repeat
MYIIHPETTVHTHKSSPRLIHVFVSLFIAFLIATPALGQLVLNEDDKIMATDGLEDDSFGTSIDIANNIIVVGASSRDDNGDNSGIAYLFDATTGTQIAELQSNDSAAYNGFGQSVAINDRFVVVAAPGNGINTRYPHGSVYVFDIKSGLQTTKIVPPDISNDPNTGLFGFSVAIYENIIAVSQVLESDSEAVYLFDANSGKELAKLAPNDLSSTFGFGWSVAIKDGIVAVGSIGDLVDGISTGSAHLFDADPDSPTFGEQTAKFFAEDGRRSDGFGGSIAINNGVVAVGSNNNPGNGYASGAVYLFDASTGQQTAKLFPDDGQSQTHFGVSLAIENNLIAIGSVFWTDYAGGQDGTGYIYDLTTHEQLAKLDLKNGSDNDRFTNSIAMDQGIVATGAYLGDGANPVSGAAYIFDINNALCPADFTEDGTLDIADVFAFIKAINAQDPRADFTNDSRWNYFDISAFLQSFLAGCP